MRFVTDRCLSCGTPSKTEPHHTVSDFWFCSEDCYNREFYKYLPKEFAHGKTSFDDPEIGLIWEEVGEETYDSSVESAEQALKRALANTPWERLRKEWHEHRDAAWQEAANQLHRRIQAEAKVQQVEQEEKLRLVREKEEEKERIAQEKEDEKERILREKEEERLEEERLAQEAEEEKLEPRKIPEKIRLEHTHILAPSGSGKTQFLQNTILEYHLDLAPPIIFIDPKGFAVEALSRVKPLRDRIVIIDPFDSPALGLFDMQGRSPNQLISDFAYIFSTTNQSLTGKQAPCFSFCARLLFTIPDANLFTLLDLLNDRIEPKKPPNPIFLEAIPKLPEVARRFFETDYYSSNYTATREQIKARIWGVLENDSLATMLNSKVRKLNLAECIRKRNTVLVNTRMVQLKEAHQTLGRYIISLVQDAIQSRKERDPVYLIIDEFQEFADEIKTPSMLRLIREYGGGVTLAHQNMFCAELNDNIRNAISTNTSIKYAASPEADDLGYMAKNLRCKPEFLSSVHKTKHHARFACFVRGLQPPLTHPFIVESEFGWIDDWPEMRDIEHRHMLARNRVMLKHYPNSRVAEATAITHKAPEGALRGEPITPAEVMDKKPTQTTDKPIVSPPDDPSKPATWTRK